MSDHLDNGKMFAAAGKRAEAFTYLRRAVLETPQNPEAWFWLGDVLDDPAKKRDCFQRALRLQPDYPQARAALARLDANIELEAGLPAVDPVVAQDAPLPAKSTGTAADQLEIEDPPSQHPTFSPVNLPLPSDRFETTSSTVPPAAPRPRRPVERPAAKPAQVSRLPQQKKQKTAWWVWLVATLIVCALVSLAGVYFWLLPTLQGQLPAPKLGNPTVPATLPPVTAGAPLTFQPLGAADHKPPLDLVVYRYIGSPPENGWRNDMLEILVVNLTGAPVRAEEFDIFGGSLAVEEGDVYPLPELCQGCSAGLHIRPTTLNNLVVAADFPAAQIILPLRYPSQTHVSILTLQTTYGNLAVDLRQDYSGFYKFLQAKTLPLSEFVVPEISGSNQVEFKLQTDCLRLWGEAGSLAPAFLYQATNLNTQGEERITVSTSRQFVAADESFKIIPAELPPLEIMLAPGMQSSAGWQVSIAAVPVYLLQPQPDGNYKIFSAVRCP